MNTNPLAVSSPTQADATSCPTGAICPLNRIRAGTAVRIKKLCATPEITRRLREIGLYEEQIIRLLNGHANLICQVCNTRLAISNQVAQAILVEPISP